MMKLCMKTLLLMAACCMFAFLGACTDGEPGVSSGGKYIEDRETRENQWTALGGTFELPAPLVPTGIEVTLLDENLDSIGNVDTEMMRERGGFIVFESDSMVFASPLLRIRYTCAYKDSSSRLKMEFEQYVDMDVTKHPVLRLTAGLLSERTEFLVQEDGFYLTRAKEKAFREMYDLLDYENRKQVNLDQDSGYDILLSLEDLLYKLCLSEKPDSTFYGCYSNLRSAVGSGKTWRDLLSEDEFADNLFAQNTAEEYREVWVTSFGLPACDSASYKDTASVKNKKSVYYKRILVCDNEWYGNSRVINKFKWRLLTDFETERGVCTFALRDTVEYNGAAYVCDSAKTDWSKMADKQGVPYLYGTCTDEVEGDSVLYDSTYYACVAHKDYWHPDGQYEWTSQIPEDERWTNPVNVFVRKHEGLCNEKRDMETAVVDGKYYQCYENAWEEIDRFTYFLGRCNSLTLNKKAHHDSTGYFECKGTARSSNWEEVLIPNYYGDVCNAGLEGYVKEYDGIYFICRTKWSGSNCWWEIPSISELPVPVRNGNLCEKANMGEVVEYDGVGYKCSFPKWTRASEYELSVRRAIVRNKFKTDYCRDGSNKTSLFWDDADTTLYGCVGSYTDANYGWGRVSRGLISASFAELDDPKSLVGGVYEGNDDYVITRNGTKYTFNHSQTSRSGDLYRVIWLRSVTPESGTPLEIRGYSGTMVIRAPIGDSAVALDKVEGKTAVFDGFFADWKDKIIESTRCPDATLPGITCVSDWDESTLDVSFEHYGETAYSTWEQAKALCPEGSRIPSAEEWLYSNYVQTFYLDPALIVKQKRNSGYNGTFSARYDIVWTSTEKDSDTQYCYEYVRNANDRVIASGIIECPKNLYPMVQAYCVSEAKK